MTTRTMFRHVCTFCDRMLRPEEVHFAVGDDACIECATTIRRAHEAKDMLFGHGWSMASARRRAEALARLHLHGEVRKRSDRMATWSR